MGHNYLGLVERSFKSLVELHKEKFFLGLKARAYKSKGYFLEMPKVYFSITNLYIIL